MEAALSQLSMHHAELALRIVVGVVLGGLIGWERNVEDRHFELQIPMRTSLAAGARMYAVAGFIAILSFAILYGLRKKPQQRLSDGRKHEGDGDGKKVPKESES